MSSVAQSMDITPTKGMNLRSLDKSSGSPFLLNIIPRNGEFASRKGFGLRKGYGTQLAGGLQLLSNAGTAQGNRSIPLGPCIGTTAYRCFDGTVQIVAVHTFKTWVGDFAGRRNATPVDKQGTAANQLITGVTVVVHDLSNDRHYEFPLVKQNAASEDLLTFYPHYATAGIEDHSKWFIPAQTPTYAEFTTIDGVLVMAIDQCGVWAYRGVHAFASPQPWVSSVPSRRFVTYTRGEPSCLSPVELKDGADAPAISYFQQYQVGNVITLTTWRNRAVYAVGNTLLFSDIARPDLVRSGNVFTIPTNDPLTCIATVRGALFVSTARQCWVYQPSEGELVSGGQLTDMSNAVGVISNTASTLADAGLFFVGPAGIYLYSGGLDLQWLTQDIDRLWADDQSLQMALTNYYTALGITQLASPQPPARVDVRAEATSFNLQWWPLQKTLLCVGPSITLCWTQGFGWHVWSLLTQAGSADEVQARDGFPAPRPVVVGDDVFLVASPWQYLANLQPDTDARWTSAAMLLQYGRGGNVDLTMHPAVEWRPTPWNGKVNATVTNPSQDSGLFLSEPQFIRGPLTLPSGQVVGNGVWTVVYWYGNDALSSFSLTLEGAANIYTKPSSSDVDFILPPNRLASLVDPAVFTCQIVGTDLVASFNGAAGTWTYAPDLIGSERGIQPLFAFGSGNPLEDQIVNITGAIGELNGVRRPVLMQVGSLLDSTTPDAQPIDWAVKSANITANGNVLRTRGSWIRAMSWAKATDPVVPDWPFGPVNTFTSSDYRDYSTQAVDFAGLPIPANGVHAQPRVTEQTNIDVLPRMITNSATQTLQPKVFGDVAGLCPRWGDVNTPTAGNLLIDDAAVDTLATSDGSAGTLAGVMVHGTINAPAEGVRIGQIRTAIQVIGGHRRTKGGVQ